MHTCTFVRDRLRRLARRAVAVLTFLATLLSGGCGGAPTEIATPAPDRPTHTARGESETLLPASPDKIIDVAQAVAQSMRYVPVSRRADDLDGTLLARGEDQRRFYLAARAQPDGQSRVWLRFGVTGDPALQEATLRQIRARLEDQTANAQ